MVSAAGSPPQSPLNPTPIPTRPPPTAAPPSCATPNGTLTPASDSSWLGFGDGSYVGLLTPDPNTIHDYLVVK